jgi:hypothetical protein
MAKRYAYSFTLAGLMALMVGFAFQADAGLLFFSDRASWQTALGEGAGLAYNFNSLTADVSFASNAINFGPFRLSALGVPPPGADKIVADSVSNDPKNPNFGVNGTPFASMFLDSTRSVALDFTHPALAFGADFLSNAINFGVFTQGSRNPIIFDGPPPGNHYFGLISTEPIDRIEFLYGGPAESSESAAFDDVGFASTPAPSSLMLLGIGAAMFAAYCCWRLRRGKIGLGTDQA